MCDDILYSRNQVKALLEASATYPYLADSGDSPLPAIEARADLLRGIASVSKDDQRALAAYVLGLTPTEFAARERLPRSTAVRRLDAALTTLTERMNGR